MAFTKKINHEVQAMTLEAAADYARQLIEHEMRGPGDAEGALFRLEQRYGLSGHQLNHLRLRRAKSCDISLFARLKMAYLDMCERQVSKLQHQIAVERAVDDDADLEDLVREAADLAERIAAKKAGLRFRASQRGEAE